MQLHQAIVHINRLPLTQFTRSAKWYQSPPWGVTDQADFINTVIEIQTSLSPLSLLKAIKIIEYRLMQRQHNLRWHARKIDIDILLFGQHQLQRKELILPHPLIAERGFVYKPLMELKPKLPAILKQKLHKVRREQSQTSKLTIVNVYTTP